MSTLFDLVHGDICDRSVGPSGSVGPLGVDVTFLHATDRGHHVYLDRGQVKVTGHRLVRKSRGGR